MLSVGTSKIDLPTYDQALSGRAVPLFRPGRHFVTGLPLDPLPDGSQVVLLGMGCFWGAERKLWQIPGVLITAVGYAGGVTPNPTYEEVCTGRTGHAEVVRVAYDPAAVAFEAVLRTFWEGHDPTQGMRQGNDFGTQYRSALYWATASQRTVAEHSAARYAEALARVGKGPITTEIHPLPDFYFAEETHQQYLAKNPGGYCGLGGTGVRCDLA